MNVRVRVVLAAAFCLQFSFAANAQNTGDLATVMKAGSRSGHAQALSNNLIAAGIPSRPQPSATMPDRPPEATNASAIPSGPIQNPDQFLKNNQIPKPEEQKPAAKATVEYNEALPADASVPTLSVVNALNEALMNNPRAAAIRAQFAIARANYALATQTPNPRVFMDRGLVAEQVMRLGPLLTFEPPWKLVFRLLATKRLVARTKIDLLTTLWQLRADTRQAYMEVVVAQETLKTLEQLYDLSSKLLSVSRMRFQAGDVPELDMLKARLANSQTEVELGVGRVRVVRARQQLNVMMGRPVHSPMNIPGLPDYTGSTRTLEPTPQLADIMPNFRLRVRPLRDYIAIAMENRLELKSLAQQIKLNQINLKGAYGNAVPNASVALGKSTGGNPPIGPKLTAVFFTVNAESIFSNVNQGNIFRYKAIGNQLKYQIGLAKNIIISQVASAYQKLLGHREKLQIYQEHVLADSYEVARLARRSYEVGQSGITATLQAQQNNVQIRSQYLEAVTAYTQAFTELEQACGKPLQ